MVFVNRRRRLQAIGHALQHVASTSAEPLDNAKFRLNAHVVDTATAKKDLCSLTPEQLETYHRQGWVTPDQFRISDDVLQRIKDDHTRFVERYKDSHPEFGDYCGSILNFDLAFLNYARDPNILNMVEQCIGPDIAIWNSSFFAKPPHTGRKVSRILLRVDSLGAI
jgi:hypothetical protein